MEEQVSMADEMNTFETIEKLKKELKPCPFCGGRATILIPHPKFMLKKFHHKAAVVICTYCECQTRFFNLDNKTGSPLINQANEKEGIRHAVNAWNKRDKTEMEDCEND